MPIFGKISVKASSLFWGTSHSPKKSGNKPPPAQESTNKGQEAAK